MDTKPQIRNSYKLDFIPSVEEAARRGLVKHGRSIVRTIRSYDDELILSQEEVPLNTVAYVPVKKRNSYYGGFGRRKIHVRDVLFYRKPLDSR